MAQLYDSNNQAQQSLMFFESELFKTVQMSHIFTDSKTFADAIPKMPIKDILHQYQIQISNNSDFNLVAFINKFFDIPLRQEISVERPSTSINTHIETLWSKLEKKADKQTPGSLLPLNGSYIVPGGRFQEIYYWDTFFTALGLIESDRTQIVESMLNHFIDLQSRYGCIPNGNRSYYLSRSQPPILGLLVELLLPKQSNKTAFLSKNISAIETEYQFWMQGHDELTPTNTEHMRVVKMPNGDILNRYWDESISPRPESYCEDMELLNEATDVPADVLFRNIRAACESGWDFSSRWLTEKDSLASIRTTRIIPIDLNCLLYKMEVLLSHFYEMLGENNKSKKYQLLANSRKAAIEYYMWSEEQHFYMDFDLDSQHISPVKSLAGVLPLFVEITTASQAKKISQVIENQFLQSGGLITTTNQTLQQWDAPNGWAPLQWFTAQGLLKYQEHALAETIMQRWLNTIDSYFEQTGKLMEKYNVCQTNNKASGGEYDVQEGFGWTNGVYQAFQKHLSSKSDH